MKYIFFLVFTTLSAAAFSQDGYTDVLPSDPVVPVITLKQYGYIDGVRLDSIPSEYAEVVLEKFMYFDYGQGMQKKKSWKVTDQKGVMLKFKDNATGVLLNFLDYNGWEYVDSYLAGSFPRTFIVKKKRGN
jgi:hypothetical protein